MTAGLARVGVLAWLVRSGGMLSFGAVGELSRVVDGQMPCCCVASCIAGALWLIG